jgi:hypothetical protein
MMTAYHGYSGFCVLSHRSTLVTHNRILLAQSASLVNPLAVVSSVIAKLALCV